MCALTCVIFGSPYRIRTGDLRLEIHVSQFFLLSETS